MRYVKQQNGIDCGPVGILNAFKWLGYQVSAKSDLADLKKVCDCIRHGTTAYGMQQGLGFLEQAYNAKVGHFTFRKKFDIRSIEVQLQRGNAILLACGGHIWFLIGFSQSRKSLYIANASHNTAVRRLSRKRFHNLWKKTYGRRRYGWVVSKKPFSEWFKLKKALGVYRYTQ